MKIKTSELTGPALDWAVAMLAYPSPDYEPDDWEVYVTAGCSDEGWVFSPSTDWAQGGPIIEREKIELHYDDAIGWKGEYLDADDFIECYGPTPLIAAMRCYCCSKLGDEVEIPEELT